MDESDGGDSGGVPADIFEELSGLQVRFMCCDKLYAIPSSNLSPAASEAIDHTVRVKRQPRLLLLFRLYSLFTSYAGTLHCLFACVLLLLLAC